MRRPMQLTHGLCCLHTAAAARHFRRPAGWACRRVIPREAARVSSIKTFAMAAPKMPRRALGKTGLEVSVLGFGASPLGGVFQVGLGEER